MKKSVIFFGLMVVGTILFAQQKADSSARAAKHANKLKSELALTDVQYDAIKAIDEKYGAKQTKVFKDSTLTKELKHKKLRDIQLEKASAIQKVLTVEQKNNWASMRSEQAKKKESRGKRSQRERSDRLQESLSLSDEQTSKIKAIDKEFMAKFRALKNDSALAKDDSRQKAKSLKEEYRLKTKAVLTEEQFEKWEAQRAERKREKS